MFPQTIAIFYKTNAMLKIELTLASLIWVYHRVGIKPGFYHKAQPGGFYGFYEGGFLGFYVGFINLKVYHTPTTSCYLTTFLC